MLEKTFDPKSVEPRLYARWEASGAFSPDRALAQDPDAESFCMVIPPPNVTGSLHIGHALNHTLQDVLARFERMRGKAALWLPGTDHAGIATQMVVERQLANTGNISRREMGREEFVSRVWAWKAESAGTIEGQMRRLGASVDWSRERFTLDDGLSGAVRKVFVQLFKEGLIYRDKRLVNWQPDLQTAVSDLEVENVEVNGHMWRFRYPIEGREGEYIVVATTRPETMLGDTAVAVHPGDERYRRLVGQMVRLPLTGRLIPIIADDYADPEKGTGAVKITPADDFNDFRIGQSHNLPLINVFTPEAKLNDEVPEVYRGLDRFVARKRIVEDLDTLGLLDGVDNHRLMVPYDEKSKLVVIEPYLTDQWYVDAHTLAQPAIRAVEQGDTVFEPRHWEKTYFEWMRNIEPWCVSRQLWWGHRIPAWWGPDGKVFVEETEAAAVAAARAHYGRDEPLVQDEDVLDTWFSSALWPFSTLGWPLETEDLKRFYPTHTLATGFDIIFFWVARMMMMGLHFTGQVPFKRVFINALVLDEKGQKMSKTKGNVIDPLELVDAYGADAVRFTLTAMTGQSRSIKLSKQRIEGYRNFGTKLWNAARFCQMNECQRAADFDPAALRLTLNRWIRGEAVYRFIWNVFCDWYLEMAKPILNGSDEAATAETRATAAWVLDLCLKLLHPVSPFITEELWDKLGEFGPPREGQLITERWPQAPQGWIDPEAEAEIGWLVELVSEIRSIRAEMNVPPSARAPLTLAGAGPATRERLERHRELIQTLARLSSARETETPPAGAVPFVIAEATGFLAIAEFIDVAAERARLAKEIGAFATDIDRTAKKLANADFVARAPEEVVEENRERLAGAEAGKAKLEAALARLEAVG